LFQKFTFIFEDVVGHGCEMRWNKLMRHLKSKYSKTFSEDDMWKQLRRIGKEVLLAIISHDTCKKYAKKMTKGRHFEGMDQIITKIFSYTV
jgi:hypothetical protein